MLSQLLWLSNFLDKYIFCPVCFTPANKYRWFTSKLQQLHSNGFCRSLAICQISFVKFATHGFVCVSVYPERKVIIIIQFSEALALLKD